MDRIRWGIVATGGIARKFAEACAFESARTGISSVDAVASRDPSRAAAFAEEWGIPRSYGTYAELFADPGIDAVYIATPHNSHAELSLAALQAGKAVLCEKPVSLTAEEFAPVAELARGKGLFFMEAMWMRFNPSFRKALEWAERGMIGTLSYIRSDFCLDAPYDPKSRLYDPGLGGGALLDVGIYPVTLALSFAGKAKPESFSSYMKRMANGVDLYDSFRLTYPGGVEMALSCAIALPGIEDLRSALVVGERGIIQLPLFWMAQEARLLDREGNLIERFDAPFECNGYEYEIREVESCLLSGKTESAVQTRADSIMVMELMDALRAAAV